MDAGGIPPLGIIIAAFPRIADPFPMFEKHYILNNYLRFLFEKKNNEGCRVENSPNPKKQKRESIWELIFKGIVSVS